MSDKWKDVNGPIDGQAAVTHLPEGGLGPAHADLPALLIVTVPLLSPDKDGLPSAAEADDLDAMRSVLRKVLDMRLHARMVGSIARGGRFEVVFHAPSGAGLEDAAREGLVDFDDYEPSFVSRDDAAWAYARQRFGGGV